MQHLRLTHPELEFSARQDAGPLLNARALEGMVKIWLALAERHGRGIAFAISED